MGFTIGTHVCRKADKVVGSIESFEKDMVVLKIDEGHVSGRAQINYMSFIKKEWAKFTPKKEDEPIQEHWEMQPCSKQNRMGDPDYQITDPIGFATGS